MVYIPVPQVTQVFPNQATGSLHGFYDDIVYWEMAKKTNRFFVTFEKGEHAFQNGKMESVATMELDYPHLMSTTGSSKTIEEIENSPGLTRRSAPYNFFFQSEELQHDQPENHNNSGWITLTELKSERYFQSTLTSSLYVSRTYQYGTFIAEAGNQTITSSRTVSASYYYPFTQHQLSVLRPLPSILINLDKQNELPEGIGTKGFALVPENVHPKIKRNLEFYLVKAGLMERNEIGEAPQIPERGDFNVTGILATEGGTIGQGIDDDLDNPSNHSNGVSFYSGPSALSTD